VTARRPPPATTRHISRNAAAWSGKNIRANWLTTTSNAPSSNGRSPASPCRHSMAYDLWLRGWSALRRADSQLARACSQASRAVSTGCSPWTRSSCLPDTEHYASGLRKAGFE
jgi:hypothetical protein